MEHYNAEKAARVWERVHNNGSAPDGEAALLKLITEKWTDAITYLHLSRRYQGKDAAALRRMFEEEQAHTNCLRGIYTLMTGTRPTVHTPQPPKENTDVILRRCYGREMRSLAQCEQRSGHPEYGAVYSRLAAQEREHCRTVLELIGKEWTQESRK